MCTAGPIDTWLTTQFWPSSFFSCPFPCFLPITLSFRSFSVNTLSDYDSVYYLYKVYIYIIPLESISKKKCEKHWVQFFFELTSLFCQHHTIYEVRSTSIAELLGLIIVYLIPKTLSLARSSSFQIQIINKKS